MIQLHSTSDVELALMQIERLRAEFQLFCCFACDAVRSTIVNDRGTNTYTLPDTPTAQARLREYVHFWEAL